MEVRHLLFWPHWCKVVGHTLSTLDAKSQTVKAHRTHYNQWFCLHWMLYFWHIETNAFGVFMLCRMLLECCRLFSFVENISPRSWETLIYMINSKTIQSCFIHLLHEEHEHTQSFSACFLSDLHCRKSFLVLGTMLVKVTVEINRHEEWDYHERKWSLHPFLRHF